MAAGLRSWIFAPLYGWPFAAQEGETTIGEPSIPVIGIALNRGPGIALYFNRGPSSASPNRIGPANADPSRPV